MRSFFNIIKEDINLFLKQEEEESDNDFYDIAQSESDLSSDQED